MDPLLALVLGGVGGFASGLVMAIVKPFGQAMPDDSKARRVEARKERRAALDRAWNVVVNWKEPPLTALLAEIGDPRLTEAVNPVRVESDVEKALALRNNAQHRIGELIREEEQASSGRTGLLGRRIREERSVGAEPRQD